MTKTGEQLHDHHFEALRESHEIQRDLAEKLLQTSGIRQNVVSCSSS